MLKTLITTCLLTFSCATGGLKELPQTNDVNIRNAYQSNYLSGTWCFKDDYVFDTYVTGNFTYYDYTMYANGVESPKVLFLYGGTHAYINARSINIYVYDDDIDHDVFIGLGEETISADIFSSDDLVDFDNSVRNCVVYFPSGWYCTNDEYVTWTNVFTRSGNEFVQRYTGWYSFINYNKQVIWQVSGNMIINNNFYDYLDFYNGTCYSQLGENTSMALSNNGTANGNYQIYFENVLIPNSYYILMQETGVFDYVYQPVQYTFGDMIFSVIDAPIYMLSQLFSFELFGIQFYVAFMGVTTVLLIFFIVRKVV